MAGPVYTIQSSDSGLMVNNTKSFENFSAFLAGFDVTHQNMDGFTGYIRGISRIFMHKPPLYMQQILPDETKQFKTILETFPKSITGIGDLEVEFTEYEGGFNADKFSSVQASRDSTDTITISVYELHGSPLRVYLDTWISGVRDPRSGVAHYHGAFDSATPIDYGDINHTCEFIYATLDPTARKIEYSCMLANGFPTKVPKDHLNFEGGNRDNVPYDLEFRIKKYESRAINDIASWYIINSKVDYNYLDFDPNKAGTGYNDSYTFAYGSGGDGAIQYPADGNVDGTF